jgi:ribonucleoside-diphosphate reductase alpha chain
MTRQPNLTPNAAIIMEKRYQRKDGEGGVTETPADAIDRVVTNVASVNAIYSEASPDDNDVDSTEFPAKTALRAWTRCSRQRTMDADYDTATFGYAIATGWHAAEAKADEYRTMITNLDFLPNSPTWTGAGTPLGQLAACFVLPIEDDLVQGRASIFETLRVAAAIQQTGGGNGFSFGRLRPKDTLVWRSMGKASGPVGFLKTYDNAFGKIAQGGSRRGANMGVLPISHPDVLEFINAKVIEGEIANFNISVAITDDFMQVVEKDGDWTFHHDGKDYGTLPARDLFNQITTSAWIIGDPGCLFIDAANRQNPVPARHTLEATNPCGEQWLGPYENCCLGSINLANFADWASTAKLVTHEVTFDWEGFRKTIILATDFLDDVVDANQYVESVPELAEAAAGGRRIGLGLMGLADAMAKLGIRYGSDEGQEFASQVTEFARFHTVMESIQRAKERGSFEWIEGSIYDPKAMKDFGPDCDFMFGDTVVTTWSPPTPIIEHTSNFGRPVVDWSLAVGGIAKYGKRNSCDFTFAPTGTISNVAGLEGSGCEPFFGLAFTRWLTQEDQPIRLTYASELFAEALRRADYTTAQIEHIATLVVANNGSCQGIAAVPDHIQHAFPVAADVTPGLHVMMQAVLQRFVDNSISKTINMPFEATVEDVQEVYKLAWEMGCKGITIYRQGSRQVEVLTTGPKVALVEPEVEVTVEQWPFIKPMSIPAYANDSGLAARVYPVDTAFGKVQVTVTEHDDFPGRPFDVRLQLGKTGADKNADVEALGRMISAALRAGVTVDYLVDQLVDIGGLTSMGFGQNRVKSVADGVARLLRKRYMTPAADTFAAIMETVVVSPIVPSSKAYIISVNDDHVSTTLDTPRADMGRTCPRCHQASLVMESGCAHCDIRLGGCGLYEGCE